MVVNTGLRGHTGFRGVSSKLMVNDALPWFVVYLIEREQYPGALPAGYQLRVRKNSRLTCESIEVQIYREFLRFFIEDIAARSRH
jgi:hypothetical protein